MASVLVDCESSSERIEFLTLPAEKYFAERETESLAARHGFEPRFTGPKSDYVDFGSSIIIIAASFHQAVCSSRAQVQRRPNMPHVVIASQVQDPGSGLPNARRLLPNVVIARRRMPGLDSYNNT
jgi:hypothetical protein